MGSFAAAAFDGNAGRPERARHDLVLADRNEPHERVTNNGLLGLPRRADPSPIDAARECVIAARLGVRLDVAVVHSHRGRAEEAIALSGVGIPYEHRLDIDLEFELARDTLDQFPRRLGIWATVEDEYLDVGSGGGARGHA